MQLTPDLAAAQATTADWESVPGRYQAAVAAVKATGIITGVDGAGTFNRPATMSRAQAATVMCLMDDALTYGLNIPPLVDGTEGTVRREDSGAGTEEGEQASEQAAIPNEPPVDDQVIEVES